MAVQVTDMVLLGITMMSLMHPTITEFLDTAKNMQITLDMKRLLPQDQIKINLLYTLLEQEIQKMLGQATLKLELMKQFKDITFGAIIIHLVLVGIAIMITQDLVV